MRSRYGRGGLFRGSETPLFQRGEIFNQMGSSDRKVVKRRVLLNPSNSFSRYTTIGFKTPPP